MVPTSEERIEVTIRCVYRFGNPNGYVPLKVLVQYYDGKLIRCCPCEDFQVSIIMPIELFLSLEPFMVDRL